MDDSKNQAGNARLLNMPGRRDQMLRAMLLCALTAAIFFLPFYIIDGGFFHYAGDFNSQQISFYRYMNGFIKGAGYPDGMAGAARSTFSWATDLGSGAMNAYSFYLYGSPFFWLSLIFPQNWLPYLMVPLLVLKFAVAGGGAYRYLCRTLQMGSVSTIVSTHSSSVAPFKNMVPRILDVSVARMLAFTPLPMPSARIMMLESSVFNSSTLSPQRTSVNLFRLL